MRQRILIGLAILFLAAAPAVAQDVRIAAIVNDGVITTGDLEARMTLVLRSSGMQDSAETRQRMAPRLLRTLIDERLEQQEAKRLNLTVNKKEVAEAMERIEKQNNLPKGGLDKYLQNLGVPKSALVDQLTASLTWNRLVQQRLAQDVSVSDQEVSDAYKELKESEATPQSNVAEIFLAIDNPNQESEVRALADRLEQQLHAGGNFSAIAQQFSQSPTAASGGSLGWVTPSQINPDLAKALSALKPGEVSDPIRAGGGFYILGLIDRRIPGQANPNETLVDVVEAGAPMPPNAPPEFRDRLARALGEITHAGTSCQAFAAAAHKIGLPFVKEAAAVRVGTMAPGVRRVTLDLKVGEVSKPFPVQGGVGLVMLCARKDAAAPKLPTIDEVRYNIERQRLDVLARRYLRDLRRGAYVDIRG
ncbi:MAG TPA: peptidylprolyl isomerase [Stellaceae bacterium]|nr:peptidylprolyl isomerase [Stellaceae bacterium]